VRCQILNKWYYIFKTLNKVVLSKYINPIDNSNRKKGELRKNSISFGVKNLKQLLRSKNLTKILVEFEQEDKRFSSSYLHKTVCIIAM